jgi:glycosyltransferase involved in cell wall biosynthesis
MTPSDDAQPKHIVIDNRIRRASTGRYSDRLVEHLQKIDKINNYTILLQPDDPWQPTPDNFKTAPCAVSQFSLNPLDQIRFARQLYELKPDLVHFTMTQQPLLYFGKIVTTTHDTTMYHFVRRGSTPLLIYQLKMGLYKFLVWYAHRKSDRIIVPTQTVADEFAELQPFTAKKLVVTHEASEPPLKQVAIKPKQLGANDRFIMYLGTAFPHKNLPRLMEAFDILQQVDRELKLVLVGKIEKHYEELIEQIKQHRAAKNIMVTGFLPDEEAKWLYEHCQAYVFPSLSEGFGLPALEAMTHGAVVVSSRASCLPEVYGPAAHYFDPENPADMAAKIGQVLTDQKLRNRLQANSKQQIKKYSWRKMAEQTLTVYKQVLGQN